MFSGGALGWRGCEILVISPTPTHPQDHGNRKRIYEICRELKRQGARIHFVHYAAEQDWRYDRPVRWENEMKETWDSYQLVAPSRPLHEGARNTDHLIDEWADLSLGHYIRWAFTVQNYDVVLVNYTWMSFCFDHVPAGVFKICDTHDVFGGRRELLAQNGLEPEFFHTTRAEEAKGLARADLVWAIKHSEQEYFQSKLGVKHCVTMLHAEPERGWWNGRPSSDGWLRAGVIGARNNVNRRNLEAFLNEALPAFEQYMAPVKIVIAGGCAEDFQNYVHPNVEVVGRVAEVEDFYRSVDVVIAPMKFSTGLKIKVAEALASGAPLIAHAHAMEGFPIGHPLHALADFKTMAVELVKLAFEPSGLDALATRSRAACAEIRASVDAAFAESRRKMVEISGPAVCVVAPLEALDQQGILFDQLWATLNYLRFAARIILFLAGKSASPVDPHTLQRRGMNFRTFVDPDTAQSLGDAKPDSWTSLDLETVLDNHGGERAYFLCEPQGLDSLSAGILRRSYLRYEAITLTGGDPQRMIDTLAPVTEVVILASTIQDPVIAQRHYGVTAFCQVPWRRNNHFQSKAFRPTNGKSWNGLFTLASENDGPIAEALSDIASRLGFPSFVLHVDDAAAVRRFAGPPNGEETSAPSLAGSRLVVDLSNGSTLASVIREGANRLGVPTVALIRGRSAPILSAHPRPDRPVTIGGLFRTVSLGLVEGDFRRQLLEHTVNQIAHLIAKDAGWHWLWRELTGTAGHPKEPLAALFG